MTKAVAGEPFPQLRWPERSGRLDARSFRRGPAHGPNGNHGIIEAAYHLSRHLNYDVRAVGFEPDPADQVLG